MWIYHYTVGDKVRQIQTEGFLRPSTAGVPYDEEPITWFSSHTFFEPTARKMFIREDGTSGILSVREMCELCNGVYRYGLRENDEELMIEFGISGWDVIKVQARISKEQRRRLAISGRSQGARTSQWYGTIKDVVPIDRLRCEKLHFIGTHGFRWHEHFFLKPERTG